MHKKNNPPIYYMNPLWNISNTFSFFNSVSNIYGFYPVIRNLDDFTVCGIITPQEIETGKIGQLYYNEKYACFIREKRAGDTTYYSEDLKITCIS